MKKPFIIAEIAQGYEGNAKLVQLYIKSASTVGADAIKFQIFYADELALPDYRYYNLFKSLELPFKFWKKAVYGAHERKLEFYSDIFGVNSYRKLSKIGVDGYKIHATDINNYPLLKIIAGSKKKIFLSTGGCRKEEIERALDLLSGCRITLMYGFQAEPTQISDNNLNRIKIMRELYNKPVGFQDHTAGDSKFSTDISIVALGLGVEIIEKHLTLSRMGELEDSISALTPEEFLLWSKKIKQVFQALGKTDYQLTEKEINYRNKVKRAICSCRKIARGRIIEEKDLTLKRSGSRNILFEPGEILGKKALRVIEANSALRKGDF